MVSGSGYRLWTAVHYPEPIKLGVREYPTNSFDGTYQHVIWSSIDARYYRNAHDPHATFEHANSRYTYKFLNYSASVLMVPQHDFGNGILPGSVEITSSHGFNLTDDKNGNLYDPSIDTGSFADNRNLVAHWDVHNKFRGQKKINFEVSDTNFIEYDEVYYKSNVFGVDNPSKSKNVSYSLLYTHTAFTASQINGSNVCMGYNIYATPAYTITDHRPEFNFPDGDFTIAFWSFLPDSQPGNGNYLSVITKNGVVRKETYGTGVVHKSDIDVASNNVFSQSYFNESTNVYPYDISLINFGAHSGKLIFRRSDGINTFAISSSNNPTDLARHYAIVKSGSLVTMYIDGTVRASGSDNTGRCYNQHALMFGSRDMIGTNGSRSTLNDVRFYDRAFPRSTILTLASGSMASKQTAVVGNVFYKSGCIVIGSHDPTYNHIFDSEFTLKFRNKHTIYQWETLVRIPKGDFNLTQNPTALQHPYSDLLLNDFTGSNPNSDLYPYATTIGLHDDNKELLAVCKLSQPIKMRDDVDVNILVRFDT